MNGRDFWARFLLNALAMCQRKRRLRSAFVATAAILSSSAIVACAGESSGDGGTGATAGSGASSGGQGQSGGSGGVGGTGATGATAGAGATGGDGGIACPADPPRGYGWDPCTADGTVCNYNVECQSGPQSFAFKCDGNGYWKVEPKNCAKPFDSCPNTMLYCGSLGWSVAEGTDPPQPCPISLPAKTDTCFAGHLGSWGQCGYRCDASPNAKWTVLTCEHSVGDSGTEPWKSDGACDP